MRSFLCLLLLSVVAQSAHVKHLAGPPSEFSLHRVPNPADVETLQRSATRNIWFEKSGGSLLASHVFPVESSKFVLSFASPVEGIRLVLLNPKGETAKARVEKLFRVDDSDDDQVPVTVFIVEDAAIGQYTLEVHQTETVKPHVLSAILDNPRPDGQVSFIVDDNLVIHSHLQSYLLKAGQDIGLVATVKPTPESGLQAELMGLNKAVMEVILPDGTSVDIPMHDDGLNGGDLMAGDSTYSAKMQATQPGIYILESILDGELNTVDLISEDGFERTAQHVIVVSSATVDISGKAFMTPVDEKRVNINIAVENVDKAQPTLRAYAEVLGTSGSEKKAAAWIGGLVEVTNGVVSLELNLDWLQLAGVSGPLYLQNVYLSDATTSFPVSIYSGEIQVAKSEGLPRHWAAAANTNISITTEMREGVNPLQKVAKVEGVPDLLLLPGYCADVNPWALNSGDFTNGFFPVDKGNYNNQEYAEKIIAAAEAQGMTRYGIVAHSQGGMVAAHMANYFFTGLENAEGERLIQSVGTPYNGNTAAGSAASLGEIFGIGCGSNSDLSRDGAVNWVAGISSATRAKIHYFTTTYQQGNFFGDYCSLPMNLVLQWPNDGITELEYAQLPGANNGGNKEKWCHSTDMGYPAQTADHDRNAEMNSKAAR